MFFANVLPTGTNAIVVLGNTCGQVYTYQVDGFEAWFLGFGDLHDAKFDYLGSPLAYFVEQNVSISLEQNGCTYSVRIYPSQELEDSYLTNAPIIYAVSLAAVFLLTSVLFVLYDYSVERRQTVVLNAALQSGAIVSSLFPEEVRQRLYEEHEAKRQKDMEVHPMEAGHGALAIAKLYHNCSVVFMDIAGFTQFSSTRTPADVFNLLETLFAAFDKAASKRHVFKIEVRNISLFNG